MQNTPDTYLEPSLGRLSVVGAYALDTISGTMAAGLAAGAPIYSCRWGDSTGKVMIVRLLAVEFNSLATGFTAGVAQFDAQRATGFTVSDSAGNSILPTTGKAKRRTTYSDSTVTSLRQSSTATLTAGTRTLDTNPFGHIRAQVDVTANKIFVPGTPGNPPAPLYEAIIDRDYPLVLKQDEGFVINATVPATGTWEFRVLIEWQEAIAVT